MDPSKKENLKTYLLVSGTVLFLLLMLWLVLFTNWIVQPDPFPPVYRSRIKFALFIGTFLILVLFAFIFRNRLPQNPEDIRTNPLLLEKYNQRFRPFWYGRKFRYLPVMLVSLVVSAVSAMILFEMSTGPLLPGSFLPPLAPALEVLFFAGLIVFIVSLGAFIFRVKQPEGVSEAMVELAQKLYDAEKIFFNAKTGQDDGYQYTREDLAGRANRFLGSWILYVGCIAFAFFLIVSQIMTRPGAAQWTIAGAVVALFPAFFLENRYFLARRLLIGLDGLDESHAHAYLSTGIFRRSVGLFTVSLAVFCVFFVTICAGVLLSGLTLYFLFTSFLPVLLLAVLATLGITWTLFRIK
jgi:hypothetical protein